jgi:WD40 repeat protein
MFMKNCFVLVLISYLLIACKPQNEADNPKNTIPELGDYTSFNVTGSLDLNYQFNNANNAWEWKWNQNVQFLPSPLGKLRFNANGKYDFVDLQKTGTYQYDETTKLIKFTGFLDGAEGRYRVQRGVCILLIVSKDGNTVQYEKKSSIQQPDLQNPNGTFKGTILTSLADKTMHYLDIATAKTLKSHSADAFGVSGSAAISVYVYKNNPLDLSENYPNVEIKDAEGKQIAKYKGASNTGKQWAIGDYWYAMPSPDGAKIALTGKYYLHSNPFDPNYRAPFPIVSVIDAKTGTELIWFECDDNNRWGAAWLPNGGLILPKKSGGIRITDATLQNTTTVYTQPVIEARASPDGKKIAFAKGNQFFTMNSDGSNIQELTNKKVKLNATNLTDMAWGADNQSLALVMKNLPFNDYYILFISLDGERFSYFNDSKGDYYFIKSPFVSWK